MGTSSGFFSHLNSARDTSLILEEKETTSIASNGSDAKERAARRRAWSGLGQWISRVPLAGVFATRSPDRPNPMGLHRVTVLEIVGKRLKVGTIEAIDGTPVVDIKPALSQSADAE